MTEKVMNKGPIESIVSTQKDQNFRDDEFEKPRKFLTSPDNFYIKAWTSK